MAIENNQLHDSKDEPSLENKKTEESRESESISLNDPMNWPIKKKTEKSIQIRESESTSLNDSMNWSVKKKTEESIQIRETESTSLNNPINWPIKKKQFIVFIISAAGTIAPISSTAVCAISNNIWQLLVMRSFQAFGGSATQSIGAGTISDIFIPTERGRAFGWFCLGPIVGPVIGPAIGGYITQYLGWRFIFVFLSIYGGAILVIIFFALPETFRHTQLSLTTAPLPKKRFNPFLPLALLRYPNLSLPILYISIIFSVIYVQNTLIPITFSAEFNLSPSNIGLVFLSPGIGFSLGSIISGSYSDFILAKNREKYVGFGTMLVFNGSSTYLIDAFPGQSASAIAVNNCFRSIAASIMSFASIPLENSLGTGLLYTLLTVFIILGTFCM
ncbi:15497_t:CDS:2, partial [Gigaspora margarita]